MFHVYKHEQIMGFLENIRSYERQSDYFRPIHSIPIQIILSVYK